MASDYRLKFIADEGFVRELRAEAGQRPDEIKIEGETREEDATRLGFDLATVAAIVAIISGALDILQVAGKIHRWFEKSNSNRVVIQTPFKTIELTKSSAITEDDVKKLLEAALRL